MEDQDIKKVQSKMSEGAPVQENVQKDSEVTAGYVQSGPSESRRFVWLALTSVVLAILAWICAAWTPWGGIALAAAAIIDGILSLKSHRNLVRNTAITSIIAATVLLVVIVAFLIVIYLGLKSI